MKTYWHRGFRSHNAHFAMQNLHIQLTAFDKGEGSVCEPPLFWSHRAAQRAYATASWWRLGISVSADFRSRAERLNS